MAAKFWGGVKVKTPFPAKKLWLGDGMRPVAYTPERVALPMQQHIGAPCEPVVQVGDSVAVGQLVGDTEAFVAAKVHASVSGKVSAIREQTLANGKKGLCVLVENDGEDRVFQSLQPAPDLADMSREDVVGAARDAGLVGMGGATFPAHVKFAVKDAAIDTLLVNGCECEPMLAADDILMQTCTHTLLLGATAIQKAVGANRVLFCIEDNKPEAIAVVQTLCAGAGGDLSVLVLPSRYPEGGEKQLIQAATGREVPLGALPSKVGVVVANVATTAAFGEALSTGMPLVRRICTVTGDVVKPQNISFPLGTLAGELIDFCGGFSGAPGRVLAGGPMMGISLSDLDVPLVKGSNGLVVLNTSRGPLGAEQPCIRCNACVDACPIALLPLFIDRAFRKEDLNCCRQLKADGCINCGCCSYVCPAKRRLAEKITEAKGKLAEQDKEAKGGKK